jgi:hypothetical protein
MDTNSYWIQKDSKGEQQNVGELMTFTSPDTGERYEVTNNCGVKEERRGFTLQASLMFKRGQILKPLENGFKRILEWCITQDHWTHTEALQRPSKPEAPVVVPTPATEVPPTTAAVASKRYVLPADSVATPPLTGMFPFTVTYGIAAPIPTTWFEVSFACT